MAQEKLMVAKATESLPEKKQHLFPSLWSAMAVVFGGH